jgi:peptidoglycan/LPS O-acetylase OafA/YrhL
VSVFLGNLLFLQDLYVPSFGTNRPLWSLSCEFWYYLMFPAGCLLILGRGLQRVAGAAVLSASALIAWYWLPLFGVWLIGALIACLRPVSMLRARGIRSAFTAAALVAFLGALIACRIHWFTNYRAAEYAVGLSFGALMLAILHFPNQPSLGFARAVAERLAGFSFTLYVVHMPLLALAAALAIPHLRWQPTLWASCSFALILATIVGFAWLQAVVTEDRTNSVRKMVERLVGSPGMKSTGQEEKRATRVENTEKSA